MFEVI